jgi:hypothetical protein
MILLEFAFKTRQQRKGVGRGASETREDAIVVEAPNFLGGAFHDRFAQRDLPIASERNTSVFTHKQDGCAANSR